MRVNTVLQVKKLPIVGPTPERLFFAGTGSLLIGSDEAISMLDVQQRRIMATLNATKVRITRHFTCIRCRTQCLCALGVESHACVFVVP
jgi:hypothetical protein